MRVKSNWKDISRPAPVEAVVAEKDDSQGVLVAADAPALRHRGVLAPRLVKLAAAHLTGRFVEAIQGLAADDAGFQFALFDRFFRHRSPELAEWLRLPGAALLEGLYFVDSVEARAMQSRAKAISSLSVVTVPSSRASRRQARISPTIGP